MSFDFPGKDRLLERVNGAFGENCPFEITTCLRKALCESIADEQIRLPEAVYEALPDHYARREVHRDPVHGYSMIAMTWGPGQGTPIHDHSGMWCVEGVWSGTIEVVSYQLLEQRGDRFRFEEAGSIMAGCGSAGSLIPPHEYHTIRNSSERKPAVSLHIYSGEMTCCNVFQKEADGWHRREARQLQLDAA